METLSSIPVHVSRRLSVREDVVQRPDGSTGIYAVVDQQDIALVIATDGDRLHLVEQYRHAIGSRSWEFPSGSAPDADLDPRELAARELREETGLRAHMLAQLGVLDVAPGTTSLRCTVFLAPDPGPGTPEREIEEQDMVSRWFTRSEVQQMMVAGELRDAKSLAAYALLLLHEASASG